MTIEAPIPPALPESAPESFKGYVVCIGASAGGLDALERFFKCCPASSGAAFVVIQHLSPDHKSIMNNLLARHTAMPVIMVEDDMLIEANHVYLIPPGAIMHVTEGHLHLTPKNPRGLTLPIDIFFSSLADVYGKKAIGIILSGTGSDGTRGAVAVNAAGGFVLAQEPETSKFDGMPRSAISTGIVDAILPPEELPRRAVAYINNTPYAETPEPKLDVVFAKMTEEEVVTSILQLLYHVGGIDFSDYKPATVNRRLERRMQVRHTPELCQYRDLMEHDRAEVITLRKEMLISVTSFFRDPEVFETLAEKVIAPLVAQKQPGDNIRVWIAGVATGEEAYTIGMLFIEAFEREHRWPNLKIFATDVDQQCIDMAGAGQYPESAAAELSPERLDRFFVKKGEILVVRNDLRQCVVFARHNLLSDPPFTKMDLVTCRNTLIYFGPQAQEHALRSLHYALNPRGVLLLGPSESLSVGNTGLQTISLKHKIFQSNGVPPNPYSGRSKEVLPSRASEKGLLGKSRKSQQNSNVADLGAVSLIALYAPPAILLSESHEAVHLYGDVNRYLRPKEGAASLEINRLLPDTLTPVASALLYKTARDRSSIVSNPVEVTLLSGERKTIRLSAHPIQGAAGELLTLLCFESKDDAEKPPQNAVDVDAETIARVSHLEHELEVTRDSLQATIEELETSNEELQATNEELMSSNEELQSSNEELQSVNEEMCTVNAEYQEKVLILNQVNADLDSLAKAAGVATVFVDAKLAITRFSPDATRIFKLRESDVGRPLHDFTHTLRYPNLMEDLARTLATGRMVECEVRTIDEKDTYLVRILPYVVPSTTVRGAVATFVDVTAIYDAKQLQSVLDALPEHIAVVDTTGKIGMVNAAWRRFARANGDPDLVKSGPGANYLEVCEAVDIKDPNGASQAAKGLREVLEGTRETFSMEYPCHSPTEERWFYMCVGAIPGQNSGAVVSHFNLTNTRQRLPL